MRIPVFEERPIIGELLFLYLAGRLLRDNRVAN